MGYYTYFNGSIVGNDDPRLEKRVAAAIANLPYYSRGRSKVILDPTDIDDVISYEAHKWYYCEEDMRKVSKQFPYTTILIEGMGEDRKDIWRAYFRNGKMAKYMARITFDDFSEEDLK